jgi:transcriptional regulator with XRE-family HTH domain
LADLRQRVGRRIRALRTDRGLSRTDLGDLVGLDVEAIGRIERGERMNFDNLEPIAVAVGVHVSELFAFETAPPAPYPLSKAALQIGYMVDQRAKSDPTIPLRLLKILRQL